MFGALTAASALLVALAGMATAAAEASAHDYIVVMSGAVDVESFALRVDGRDGVEVQQVFPASVNGLHARLTPAEHTSLSRDPEVLFVGPNRKFTAMPAPAGCTSFGPDDTYSDYSNFVSDAADQSHTVAAPGSCIASTAVDGGTRVASGSRARRRHTSLARSPCASTSAPVPGLRTR